MCFQPPTYRPGCSHRCRVSYLHTCSASLPSTLRQTATRQHGRHSRRLAVCRRADKHCFTRSLYTESLNTKGCHVNKYDTSASLASHRVEWHGLASHWHCRTCRVRPCRLGRFALCITPLFRRPRRPRPTAHHPSSCHRGLPALGVEPNLNSQLDRLARSHLCYIGLRVRKLCVGS
jgi:hypothetical protein